MSQEITVNKDEPIKIHEPYSSKKFTIGEILSDNLNLRQKLNEQQKHYERKLIRAEAVKEKAEKDLRELKEDYDLLLQDYIKLKQNMK